MGLHVRASGRLFVEKGKRERERATDRQIPTHLDGRIQGVIFEHHSLFQYLARVGRIHRVPIHPVPLLLLLMMLLLLCHVVHQTNLSELSLSEHLAFHVPLVVRVFPSVCIFDQLFGRTRYTGTHHCRCCFRPRTVDHQCNEPNQPNIQPKPTK